MADSRTASPGPFALMKRETEDPVLSFSFVKKLSYRTRVIWTGALALTGIALQIATLSVFAGIPFLIGALLLSWVAGIDNKVDRRSFHLGRAWESVPFDRVLEISRLDAKISKWDTSLLDVTSIPGALIWLFSGFALFTASGFVATLAGANAGFIVFVDGILLLMPQWISGVRTVFRQGDLSIKVNHLLALERSVRSAIKKHGELVAQLLMSGRDNQRVPSDVKISIRYEDAPSHFYGVQGQVVLNRVQGTPYPYFYAVVVAKEGHDLLDVAERVRMLPNIILETKTQKGVDIAIVRQHTTKKSGYHTKPETSTRILRTALTIGQLFVESQGQ